MPFSSANDPLHWRQLAKRYRALSQTMTDPTAKRTMEAVASAYEAMAARAEQMPESACEQKP